MEPKPEDELYVKVLSQRNSLYLSTNLDKIKNLRVEVRYGHVGRPGLIGLCDCSLKQLAGVVHTLCSAPLCHPTALRERPWLRPVRVPQPLDLLLCPYWNGRTTCLIMDASRWRAIRSTNKQTSSLHVGLQRGTLGIWGRNCELLRKEEDA